MLDACCIKFREIANPSAQPPIGYTTYIVNEGLFFAYSESNSLNIFRSIEVRYRQR